MELKYSDFYVFGEAIVCTTFTAYPEDIIQLRRDKEYDKSRKFAESLSYGEYEDTLHPLIWRQDSEYGNRLRDVLYSGRSFYLISDRFKELLEIAGLTGWKSYPIELYDKKGNKVEGYNGFSITGRAGNLCKFDVPPMELDYSPKSDGYYFEYDSWDGSDIFRVFPHVIVITKNFAELLQIHKISGVSIARLTDYGDWSKDKRIL